MTTTASQVWSRAIARAHGSVSFAASIRDIAVILPHLGSSRTISVKTSTQDLRPQSHPFVNGMSHKQSAKSLRADLGSSCRPQFANSDSFKAFNRSSIPRYTLPLPCSEGGYERLLAVDGESRAVFGLGFGPKMGLLGEDTLRSSLKIGQLHTSLSACDKLQELARVHTGKQEKAAEESAGKNNWGPQSMPRVSLVGESASRIDGHQVLLRAFESVTVSLTHLTFSHFLPVPVSPSISAESSTTDLTIITPSDADCFTLSIDIVDLSIQLSAADSSNNDRARNAFGTNPSPESKVRGVGFSLQWRSIALQCVAPGESNDDKSQLIAVRQAEFDGLTTWRPGGWTREELLFVNDPNLALIVGKGSMASIDVAGDVQLLDELTKAWHHSRPHGSSGGQASLGIPNEMDLPPRIRMVLQVGHAMVVLADGVSKHKTTLSLASDGMHFSCFTGFSDIIARRRDRTIERSLFKQEEELQQRREEAGGGTDYALPPSMLKPQLRRHFNQPSAKLPDEYAISMRLDAVLALEPMSLHMTLSGEKAWDQKTYHLMSIGRIHGTVTGDILGRHQMLSDWCEKASLDMESLSCAVDLGVDSGIKVNLWETAVTNALVAMGQAHRRGPHVSQKQSDREALMSRLLSGISARVSLGLVSVFIGDRDPNPHCPLNLIRGMWLQGTIILEYAYYTNKSQAMQYRHSLLAPRRVKLQLPEDITTQALAFFNHLHMNGGRAALIAVNLSSVAIKPIFNGQAFVESGGTHMSHEKPPIPQAQGGDHFVGWEFRRPGPIVGRSSGRPSSDYSYSETSGADQAQESLLQLRHATINWLIRKPENDLEVEHKLTTRIRSVSITSNLSYLYCAILAGLAIRKIGTAWSKPNLDSRPRRTLNFSAEISIPFVVVQFALPLKERLYIYIGGLTISRLPDGRFRVGSDQMMFYVPSPRVQGSWEELVRIRRFEMAVSKPSSPPKVESSADAFRIRIPVAYHLSNLILNITVAAKALKLLVSYLGGEEFSIIHKPGPEQPKNIPDLSFNIAHVSFEAEDDPIESNLNLIWRAGLVEQETRNALEDAFEQKVQILQDSLDNESSANGDLGRVHGQLHSPRLTRKQAVPLVEARYRLDWWHSRAWIRRIRAAKQEQRRREATAVKYTQNIGAELKLPINIAPSSLAAPLFRAALDGVKLSVCDLGMKRSELIKYMGDLSSPFNAETEFSLMIPLNLSWSMDSVAVRMRDYPLPLIRVPPVESGDRPTWHVETPFIIAEELRGDDSSMFIPCNIIPEGCGASEAAPLTVQIAKTIMPVKTYTRPVVKVTTEGTTEFTWGNSYQPAIQDFMRVVESLTSTPRDPSPKLGFWDKFRLILHWRVVVDFTGLVHLHLKGEHHNRGRS